MTGWCVSWASRHTRRRAASEPAVAYVQDADLLRTLAQAKLAKKADEIRDEEGAAWAEARLQFDYAERSAFGCVGTVRKTPTAKQQEKIDALKRQLDELDTAEGEEAWEQAEALSEQLNEIEQRLMRPERAWTIRPARTRTWMWRETACSEIPNGAASSDTSTACPSSRSRIARRTGSLSAKNTASSASTSVCPSLVAARFMRRSQSIDRLRVNQFVD